MGSQQISVLTMHYKGYPSRTGDNQECGDISPVAWDQESRSTADKLLITIQK